MLENDTTPTNGGGTPKETYISSAFRLLLLFIIPAIAFEVASLVHPSLPLFFSTLAKTTTLLGTIALNIYVLWASSTLRHRPLRQTLPFLLCIGIGLCGVVVAWILYALGLGGWVDGAMFIGGVGAAIAGVEGVVLEATRHNRR